MVVVWSRTAKNNLKEYKLNSKVHTEIKLENYINGLIEYVDTLKDFPHLGKILFENNNIEFRQLVYKMHKIYYYINNEEIRILSVVHTKHDIVNVISYLSKLI